MARKRYTIVVDDNNTVVGVEVNGQKYDAAIFIPDNIDQQRVEKMAEVATEIYPDEDFETRTTSSLGKILVSVFLTVTLIMLAIAVVSGVNTGKAIAREQNAPGRVTSFSVQADSEGTRFYYPVVAFSLPDESINTVQINEGSSSPSYEVGQQVTVLYNPDHPNQARIDSLGSTLGIWTLTLITGVMGLIFLGATGFAVWMLKPKWKLARKPKGA